MMPHPSRILFSSMTSFTKCPETSFALPARDCAIPIGGARKLKVRLAGEGVQLPRNTIHRIVQRHDLVGPQERYPAPSQKLEARRQKPEAMRFIIP